MRYDVDSFYEDIVSTTLLNDYCPICGKKVVVEYEKDYTPGFKSSCYRLVSKTCDCDIKVDCDNGEILN